MERAHDHWNSQVPYVPATPLPPEMPTEWPPLPAGPPEPSVVKVFPAVVRVAEASPGGRFVQPHFFAFGGVMKTVDWLEAVRAGRFDLDGDTIVLRG